MPSARVFLASDWRRPLGRLVIALALCVGAYQAVGDAQGPRLDPTAHPVLPGDPSQFLFVPQTQAPPSRLARGIEHVADGEFSAALPLLNDREVLASPLGPHARYYSALALKGLKRTDDAAAALAYFATRPAVGYLEQAVPLLQAEVALAQQKPNEAVAALESIVVSRTSDPALVLSRLAAAAEAAGDTERAVRALRRVYFEFPLTSEANLAAVALSRLDAGRLTPELLPLEMRRADALFGARRWAQARQAFEALLPLVALESDRELVGLRVAECDVHLNRARQAREALRSFTESGGRQVEASYYMLLATRALDEDDAFVAQARAFVAQYPSSAWTEDVLDALATHFIVSDDDAAADTAFRELLVRFPKGRLAERAAWKVGWASYRAGRFAEAADIFEVAAANAPRADFRPAWIYWAGRARDQVRDPDTATARYRLVATDYLNSYYGRLASQRLEERHAAPVAPAVTVDEMAMPSPLIPTDVLVRALVGAGLDDDATRELEYAQRVWGDSPAIQATMAWIRHHRAGQLESMERFQHLRGAINQMKRAYPQYLAAGGESLPPEVLKVIFPLDFWPLIKREAELRGLDPYLMSALVAQESTFTADIRSAANAYGLMQLIPSTGRRYATKVGLRRFSVASLKQPETNVRLGMTYFKELMDRFGGAHFALASYNAGENRVARWTADRPGLPQDEFIDDIPFPETQNYVKRILGTAEDYRRLYGGGVLAPGLERPTPRASTVQSTPSRPAQRRSVRSSRTR